MSKYDWLFEGPESLKGENTLTPEGRAALVRETFEAVAMVGFLKFTNEVRTLGGDVTDDDRKEYFQVFGDSHWPEFQAMAANATDGRLRAALQDWGQIANAKGLKEWQQEQGIGSRKI